MDCIGDQEKKGSAIKPITVIASIIIFTTILFISTSLIYWIMLFISYSILIVVNKQKTVFLGTVFCLLYISALSINHYLNVVGWIGSIYTMILIIIKLYPLWLLSVTMMSYTTSEIMNSLRKFQIPNNICISVAIFFRFLPDYIEYFQEVKEGLVVRNLRFDIRNLSKSMEVYIVPMINKAFKTGEVITASLITKGIEYNCKKTEYRNIELEIIDFLIISISVLLLGVVVWMKYFQ